MGSSNKPQARDIAPAHSAPSVLIPPTQDLPEGYYRGTLKSFSLENGFGFIHNDELRSKYGADVFLHKTQYVDYQSKWGGTLYPHSPVCFRLELGNQGKPQARDLMP